MPQRRGCEACTGALYPTQLGSLYACLRKHLASGTDCWISNEKKSQPEYAAHSAWHCDGCDRSTTTERGPLNHDEESESVRLSMMLRVVA